MAVVSRVAQIVLTNLGNTRTFRAEAATQDTAAGGSVVVTITIATSGATPPGAADSLTLEYRNDSAGVIKSVALSPSGVLQSDTFYLNSTGLTGGSARCGTVEIVLRATRTNAGTYDVETDGSPNTAPAGGSSAIDRGWIRGTTTLVEAVSNVSAGGAKNSPAQYDESLYVRATSGAASYIAQALTVASSVGSLSGSTNSTTSATRDVTFANVVDERFAAAATEVSWTVTVPNATLTGLPAWTYTSTTNDTITVDPRLTCTHHLQLDDNSFDLDDASADGRMLATETGFLATRFVGSRGAGVNGLTVTQTLTPVLPGTAASGSSATAARDGQDGWTDLLTWSASKPGGTWNKTVDVTAPSDIDGATYLVSDTTSYTMLVADPRITLLVDGGDLSNTDTHYTVGNDFTVGLGLIKLFTRIQFDADTAKVALVQFDPATGAAEFLNASNAWVTGDDVYFHSMEPSAGDAGLALKTFAAADTVSWPLRSIYMIGTAEYLGTPYESSATAALVAAGHAHDDLTDYATASELTAATNDHAGTDIDAAHPNGQLPVARVDNDIIRPLSVGNYGDDDLGGGGTGVLSVNGQTDYVVLDAEDVGAEPEGVLAAHTAAADPHVGYQLESERGEPDGYASLDAAGKVPLAQIPIAGLSYQGTWNAATNSPALADGSGTAGDFYVASTAGTQNLGSGAIEFSVGDQAVLNDALVWQRVPTSSGVSSVNGQAGDVVLDAADVGAEVAGAVAAHAAESNPHPSYLTEAEADLLYQAAGSPASYALLSGEVGVTNTSYPYGDLRRYGVAFGGSTGQQAKIQNALDSASRDGAGFGHCFVTPNADGEYICQTGEWLLPSFVTFDVGGVELRNTSASGASASAKRIYRTGTYTTTFLSANTAQYDTITASRAYGLNTLTISTQGSAGFSYAVGDTVCIYDPTTLSNGDRHIRFNRVTAVSGSVGSQTLTLQWPFDETQSSSTLVGKATFTNGEVSVRHCERSAIYNAVINAPQWFHTQNGGTLECVFRDFHIIASNGGVYGNTFQRTVFENYTGNFLVANEIAESCYMTTLRNFRMARTAGSLSTTNVRAFSITGGAKACRVTDFDIDLGTLTDVTNRTFIRQGGYKDCVIENGTLKVGAGHTGCTAVAFSSLAVDDDDEDAGTEAAPSDCSVRNVHVRSTGTLAAYVSTTSGLTPATGSLMASCQFYGPVTAAATIKCPGLTIRDTYFDKGDIVLSSGGDNGETVLDNVDLPDGFVETSTTDGRHELTGVDACKACLVRDKGYNELLTEARVSAAFSSTTSTAGVDVWTLGDATDGAPFVRVGDHICIKAQGSVAAAAVGKSIRLQRATPTGAGGTGIFGDNFSLTFAAADVCEYGVQLDLVIIDGTLAGELNYRGMAQAWKDTSGTVTRHDAKINGSTVDEDFFHALRLRIFGGTTGEIDTEFVRASISRHGSPQ